MESMYFSVPDGAGGRLLSAVASREILEIEVGMILVEGVGPIMGNLLLSCLMALLQLE